MQYREVTDTEVRAESNDETGEHFVTAKVCSYGVGPDTYNTTWSRGVWGDSIRSTLPAMVWGHDSRAIIGSAVEADDREDGLYLRMKFANFDEVPKAREAWSLIRDGHVRGWSFGFSDAATAPDKTHRGALAFTKASIYEASPVLRASIPLTRTVSVRSADGETTEARDEGALRSALIEAVSMAASDGNRGMTITVDDDGSVSVAGAAAPTVDAPVEDPAADQDVNDLASAIDAACDAADALLEGVDTTGLPAPVQQALALYSAASVAADELLDTLGVLDPDGTDDEEQRAEAEDILSEPVVTEAVVTPDIRAAEDLALAFEAAQAQLTAALNAGRR